MGFYILCPTCGGSIEIESINCGIFRHAVYKTNGNQVDPHSSQLILDILLQNDQIWGCGKPFKVKEIDGKINVEICDYE